MLALLVLAQRTSIELKVGQGKQKTHLPTGQVHLNLFLLPCLVQELVILRLVWAWPGLALQNCNQLTHFMRHNWQILWYCGLFTSIVYAFPIPSVHPVTTENNQNIIVIQLTQNIVTARDFAQNIVKHTGTPARINQCNGTSQYFLPRYEYRILNKLSRY